MHPPRRTLGVVVACVLAGTAAPALGQTLATRAQQQQASARPPVNLPAHPQGLTPPAKPPNAVDSAPTYQPQTGCAAKAMPGTVRLRALALATYGRGGTSPATPRA